MNLINPAGLALAALAIPIVVFYILKIRLRRVPVSTLMFWRQIFEEKKPRSIWQRLRHLISLLLQLAFLALLVLALADPIFRWQQARARRLVLLVDNSASMNAVDVKPSRLAVAKIEAGRLVEGLRLGDEMAVIAAGAQPRVATGFTDHQRTLREAIDGIGPSDGATRLGEAVALARRLVSGSEKAHTIVVLTDAAFENAAAVEKEPNLALVRVGGDTANLGITRFQARRSLIDPIGYEILAEVQNASDAPASCRLELDLNDEPIDVIPLELKPGEQITRIFEKTSAEGGPLRARLAATDALAADNTAWAILPRRETRKLALVTEGNLFLEKVFEAIPLVDLTVSKTPPPDSGARITVFHRKAPRVLPPGPVLVIEPGESGEFWDVGETIDNPVVAKLDKESQLLGHVRLDQVMLPEARRLTLKGQAHTLAETATGDPLYASFDRPEGKVLVLSVNLDKSDLPLQTAFPIMMTNALAWMSGNKGELRESRATGDVVGVELPKQTAGGRLVLRAPAGATRPLASQTGKVDVGPLDQAGVWTIEREPSQAASTSKVPSEVIESIACNVSNRRESDLRPPPGLPARRQELAGGLGGRPIWFYLLAAAGLLTCWEWYLYQRRWID